MSRLVLGWQLNKPVESEAIATAIARIKARYRPLFQDPIHHTGLWHENQGLLHFDAVPGDDPGLFCDPERIICLTGMPSVTSGSPTERDRCFGAKDLYDQLHGAAGQLDPRVLHRVNPPFTLCWFDRRRQELGVVHDGLGADQFFVATSPGGLVFSNRCWPILHFLGEAPRIDLAAWRYWFSLGWFPGVSTPFQNIRYLDRGEHIRADSRTVTTATEDAFATWISPSEGAPSATPMTEALHGFEQLIRLYRPITGRYGADLTGGLDSRAVCSFLIREKIPCSFHTSGPDASPDVSLARRIARRFQLDWAHHKAPRFGSDARLPELLDAQFTKLLLWGEGLVEPNRFRHFQPQPAGIEWRSYLSGGSSEISKGHYYKLRQGQAEGLEYRRALSRLERIKAPLSVRDADSVIRVVREQVAMGAAYGLRDLALLDFFYLSERTRRWQAAHLAINLFDGSVMPFLSVEHITLAFAMRPLEKSEHRFQRYIIAQNTEELLRVPFGNSLRSRLRARILHATQRLLGAQEALDWADYFRGYGRHPIESMFSADTPLWQILDKQQAMTGWNAFLRGSRPSTSLPLGLMAFRHWYDMYFESAS